MANLFDLPSSPTIGDTRILSSGATVTWDGDTWKGGATATTGSGDAQPVGAAVSAIPPAGIVQTSTTLRATGGDTGGTLTFSAPFSAGNAAIVILASYTGGGSPVTVSGSVNGAYTRVGISHQFDGTVEIWWKPNVSAGAETITVASNPGCYASARAMEWKGILSLDQTGNEKGLVPTHDIEADAPNSNAYSLVVAGFCWNGGVGNAAWGPLDGGVPTTIELFRENDTNTYTAGVFAYKVVNAIEQSRVSIFPTSNPSYGETQGTIVTFALSPGRAANQDRVFYENDKIVNNSYTIGGSKNAMTAGPISIAEGASVTIPDGSVWTIV